MRMKSSLGEETNNCNYKVQIARQLGLPEIRTHSAGIVGGGKSAHYTPESFNDLKVLPLPSLTFSPTSPLPSFFAKPTRNTDIPPPWSISLLSRRRLLVLPGSRKQIPDSALILFPLFKALLRCAPRLLAIMEWRVRRVVQSDKARAAGIACAAAIAWWIRCSVEI